MTTSRVNRGSRRAGQEPEPKVEPPLPVSARHLCHCERFDYPREHTIGQHLEFWTSPPPGGVTHR